jgi:hypothetical protein
MSLFIGSHAFAQQVSDRLLIQLPAVEKTILAEVVGVRVQGEEIRPEQYFAAGDDWLQGLTFRLRNVSDHPILYAGVELIFRAPAQSDVRRIIYRIQYGHGPRRSGGEMADAGLERVLPGESFDVVVTEEDFRNLGRLFPRAGLELGVHRVEYRLTEVGAE